MMEGRIEGEMMEHGVRKDDRAQDCREVVEIGMMESRIEGEMIEDGVRRDDGSPVVGR